MGTERRPRKPVSGSSTLSHDAEAAAAGFLFQPERALFWLEEAEDPSAEIGAEAVGHVFVRRSDSTRIHEEDKHSVQASGHPLRDQDPRLWRTLEIWCDGARNGTKEQAQPGSSW